MEESKKKYILSKANEEQLHQIKRIAFDIKEADSQMQKSLANANKWKNIKQERNRRMENYLNKILREV